MHISTGIFSIANDYTIEDEDTLDEEENDLLAVRTRHTEINKFESAEAFAFAREPVVLSCRTISITR